MVQDTEHACRDFMLEHLDDGEDSVGARVEIDHLGPTLVGQSVTFEGTVVEVDRPRVMFEVRSEMKLIQRPGQTHPLRR